MFITPTSTAPPISANQYTETINAFSNLSIGMGALFVLALFAAAIIAYVYYNRNKGQGENAMLLTFSQAMGSTLKEREERIDDLEAKEIKRDELTNEGMLAVGDGLNRIADLWTAEQKREAERDRILSDLTSGVTAIMTVGSQPLQKVVKDVGALQDTSVDIQKTIGKVFDKAMVVFPSDKPIDVFFKELQEAIIDAIDKACEERKRPAPPVNVVNVNTAPGAIDDLPKASGQ